MDNCNRWKVGKTNCSKKIDNCSKRKVGETNGSKNMASPLQ